MINKDIKVDIEKKEESVIHFKLSSTEEIIAMVEQSENGDNRFVTLRYPLRVHQFMSEAGYLIYKLYPWLTDNTRATCSISSLHIITMVPPGKNMKDAYDEYIKDMLTATIASKLTKKGYHPNNGTMN